MGMTHRRGAAGSRSHQVDSVALTAVVVMAKLSGPLFHHRPPSRDPESIQHFQSAYQLLHGIVMTGRAKCAVRASMNDGSLDQTLRYAFTSLTLCEAYLTDKALGAGHWISPYRGGVLPRGRVSPYSQSSHE